MVSPDIVDDAFCRTDGPQGRRPHRLDHVSPGAIRGQLGPAARTTPTFMRISPRNRLPIGGIFDTGYGTIISDEALLYTVHFDRFTKHP